LPIRSHFECQSSLLPIAYRQLPLDCSFALRMPELPIAYCQFLLNHKNHIILFHERSFIQYYFYHCPNFRGNNC